jgi:hypothetical protein
MAEEEGEREEMVVVVCCLAANSTGIERANASFTFGN